MSGKISNFFTIEDALSNQLGSNENASVLNDNRKVLAINYTASRLDFIKYMLNEKLDVINWYLTEEMLVKLNKFPKSFHAFGLGVEFKTINTKLTFYKLQEKILGKNTISISVNELTYNEHTDSIFISFKLNVNNELNKVGRLSKKGYELIYIDNEVNEKLKGGRQNG